MTVIRRSVRFFPALVLALASAACGSEQPGTAGAALEESSCDDGSSASALLVNAAGETVGYVSFKATDDGTLVSITAQLPASETSTIHGFHVHANDNPVNGDGCLADATQPASTHFVSADGHFNPSGSHHGHHTGDMPALFFTASGAATMSFVTDAFSPADIKGKALILHEGPDNYGNVPVGTAPTQYTPNGPDATTLTHNTGNAGARIACGVIE